MTPVPNAARLQELIDRQDILDCLARICRGTDRFDEAMFVSGFHGDAVIQSGSYSGGPAETYAGGAAAHAESTKFTLHCLSSHACEIAGDHAHAETYYLYNANNRDGTNWSAAGRYLDRIRYLTERLQRTELPDIRAFAADIAAELRPTCRMRLPCTSTLPG